MQLREAKEVEKKQKVAEEVSQWVDGFEIPEDKLEEKVNILAENGYTVKTEYVYSNIEN